MKCPSCMRRDIPENSKRCPYCGNYLYRYARWKATLLIAGVLSAVLSMIIGGILWGLDKLPGNIIIIVIAIGLVLEIILNEVSKIWSEGSAGIWTRTRQHWREAYRSLSVMLSLFIVVLLISLAIWIPFAASDPYTHGLLYGYSRMVFSDSLLNNSHHTWFEGNGCAFTHGGYQVIDGDKHHLDACAESSSVFTRFIYEVGVSIMRGDCGGIVFKKDKLSGASYLFWICNNGYYRLSYYDNEAAFGSYANARVLDAGYDVAKIHTGVKHLNVIAVVVVAQRIELWVNHQKLFSLPDHTANAGTVGMAAIEYNQPTQVIFHNVKIWTF